MTSNIDIIVRRLTQLQRRREGLARVREQIHYNHRMQLNKIQSLETQLKMKQDIAFRELEGSMRNEDKEHKRAVLEDIFPESGIVNLEGYDFLE